MSVVFLFPMFLAIMVSVTSQDSIRQLGFQVIPSEFSLEAYKILFNEYGSSLLRSMTLTVGTGIIQPILSIILTVCMAYPLSQPDFKGRDFWRKYLVVTMLFSGGLIPTYILYTKYLHLKNNILIYLLPGIGAWNVFLFRTFFVNIDKAMINIPVSRHRAHSHTVRKRTGGYKTPPVGAIPTGGDPFLDIELPQMILEHHAEAAPFM